MQQQLIRATLRQPVQASLLRSPVLVGGIRQNWQVVLGRRFDRATGTYKYQDWDELVFSFREPTKHDGTNYLQRHLNQEEHIKPTELKRRINERKVYRRSVKRLEDLTSYIQFMRDNDEVTKTK